MGLYWGYRAIKVLRFLWCTLWYLAGKRDLVPHSLVGTVSVLAVRFRIQA